MCEPGGVRRLKVPSGRERLLVPREGSPTYPPEYIPGDFYIGFHPPGSTPVTGVDDGSRIGLDEQGILALLKRVIRLKTLSLLQLR